jgi:PAS domain S-box-containing protein
VNAQETQAAATDVPSAADETTPLALLQATLLGEAADAGPMLIFVADDDMRYVAVNRRACEVLGYSRPELLALRVTDVAHDPIAGGLYQSLLRTGVQHGVASLQRKDGERLTYYYWAKDCIVAGASAWVSVGMLDQELPLLAG